MKIIAIKQKGDREFFAIGFLYPNNNKDLEIFI